MYELEEPVFNVFELKRCALKGCSKELDPRKVLFRKQKYCCPKHQQLSRPQKRTRSSQPGIKYHKNIQRRKSRRPPTSHRSTAQEKIVRERKEEVKKVGDEESIFYENQD